MTNKFKAGDKVVCHENDGYEDRFTVGATYKVAADQDRDLVSVINDNGSRTSLYAWRFSLSRKDTVALAKELMAAAEALEVAQARFNAAKAVLN